MGKFNLGKWYWEYKVWDLKLKEINLNLTTEKNFLTSLSKTEMSSIQDLNMQNAETRLKIK